MLSIPGGNETRTRAKDQAAQDAKYVGGWCFLILFAYATLSRYSFPGGDPAVQPARGRPSWLNAAVPHIMKAVVANGSRGLVTDDPPWKLEYRKDVPVPSPVPGQLLIHVRSASVNPVDWKLRSALSAEQYTSWPLGKDVAGTVVANGGGETCASFASGDDVFGCFAPSLVWAEFALVQCTFVAHRPRNAVTPLETFALLPIASGTSLQDLRLLGAPWADNVTVVVTSGAGGTGIAAIQLAKAFGAATVITAARAENHALLRSLGADVVVDYHERSIWEALPPNSVDVVFDNFGGIGTATAAMPAIRVGGVYGLVPTGMPGEGLSPVPKPGVSQVKLQMFRPSTALLNELAEMLELGTLRVVEAAHFPLQRLGDAFTAQYEGHIDGKLVIDIPPRKLVIGRF